MSVSYDVFVDAFLQKVSEYDFMHMDDWSRTEIIDGYLKRACYQFDAVCAYDLSAMNNRSRIFEISIMDSDLDEIVDIVSEGMIVQWLKPFRIQQDLLQLSVNTNDFTSYSPAELLRRVNEVYNDVRRSYKNMINEYSYAHGDLSSLYI